MAEREVFLPTLHRGQVAAFKMPGKYKAIRCGRRWGKSVMGITLACDAAMKGQYVGYFAPSYKYISEIFTDCSDILLPAKESSSKVEGVIRLKTKGRIDFWTLEDERAGRSRKYHTVIIDEAAFTKPNMFNIWTRAIRPTLLDYGGRAWALSNANGTDPENFFWRVCNEPELGFKEFHAPTHTNPYLPREELEKLERENPPLVFKQEYLAEFVNWSGVQFFALEDILTNGLPVQPPVHCDAVFAVLDTAVKTGRDNDGTAVVFYAVDKLSPHPVTIMDWDIAQIEGALLETWLPSVFGRLEDLSKMTGARMGSLGVYIEDKSTGQVLIQQSLRRGWPAQAIDSKLTSIGKDERAVSVSGYLYRKMVKLSQHAYDKTVTYKGHTRNHFLSQVLNFRVGQVGNHRDDDLLDTLTYGIALALGNNEGF